MNAKELFDHMVDVEKIVDEVEDRLFKAQKRFCMDAVEITGSVARLLYTHDPDARTRAVRDAVERLAFDNSVVSSDFFAAGCDLTVVRSRLDAAREKFVELWNGSVERHSDALGEAKRQTAAAHMQVQALRDRVREHAINSPEVRAKVWAITDGRCIYCDVEMTRERDPENPNRCFEVDHIVARSNGGPDHLSNYVPACHGCNTSKSAKSIFRFLANRQALPGLRLVGCSDS
jgi:hypothetical protein